MAAPDADDLPDAINEDGADEKVGADDGGETANDAGDDEAKDGDAK